MQEEPATQTQETKPISDLVNQDEVTKLKELGFTKEVAEKSLYHTGNEGMEKALEWIEKHNEDADF